LVIDLRDELVDAVTQIPPERLAYLTGVGIPENLVCSGPHRVGFGEIQTNGDFYEPASGAGTSAIIVAEIHADEVCDLIAFYPEAPGRWWLRRGEVEILGAEHLGERVFPTIIHPNPMVWLQSGGNGVCIVNWSLDPLSRLAFAGRLRAPLHIKRRLEKRIQETALELLDIEVCDGKQ
jgi:hypothetical protein